MIDVVGAFFQTDVTRMEPYRCILADPPWLFGDKLPGKSRGAEKNYSVMTCADICNLQLPPIADDALLFLWRVASMPQEALNVAHAWGFIPKSEIVWIKLTRDETDHRIELAKGERVAHLVKELPLHFGMGRYVRAAHETCLVCARGKAAAMVQSHSVRSVFFAPIGIHSQKPGQFYDIVESLCPGPRLELFARRERPGWTSIGDALGSRLEVTSP